MDFADPTWTVFGRFRTLFGRPRRRHCTRSVAKYWMGVTPEAPKRIFFICYLGVTDYTVYYIILCYFMLYYIALYSIGWANSRGIYQTWQFLPAFSGVLVTATAFVSPRSAGWANPRLRTSIRDPKMHAFLVKSRVPRLVNTTTVPSPYE